MWTQEIRWLPGNVGYTIKHTYGKTARVDKPNIFTLFRSGNTMICPVEGLKLYLEIAKSHGIDLSRGYLFRPTQRNMVLLQPLSYEAVYDRLKFYLSILDIYEGETPHSFRGGCAITLRETSKKQSQEGLMNHLGWSTEWSANHYSRSQVRDQATNMAETMSKDLSLEKMKIIEAGFIEDSNLGKI